MLTNTPAGGLSTNLADLKANIWLSTCVAITGIAVPIGLSFVLPSLLGGSGASPLQAFAAGAALCSTSLGTTFTLLATSGLGSCRLGVVLSSAAMMDDVVGLVMVQIISDLGASSSAIGAGTVLRPILTSLAFAIALPLAWNYVGVPLARKLYAAGQGSGIAVVRRVVNHELVPLVGLTATLIAVVTGASYAGSSPLLGAYVAGIMVSWWDQQGKTQPAEAVPRPSEGEQSNSTETDRPQEDGPRQEASDAAPKTAGENDGPQEQEQEQEQHASTDGAAVFEKYYLPALQRILRPLFFVRIPNPLTAR